MINGSTVLDTTYEGTDTPASRLTYELYFDTSTRQWTLLFNGGTYRGSSQEWKPTYMRIAKNRDGVCGTIKMVYDKTKQVFEEKRGF